MTGHLLRDETAGELCEVTPVKQQGKGVYDDWKLNVPRSAESESDIVKQGNSNKYELVLGLWKYWRLVLHVLLVVVSQLALTMMALCLPRRTSSDKSHTDRHTSSHSPPDSCTPAREDEPSSARPKSPQPPTHGKDGSHCKIAAKAPKEPHLETATEIPKDKEQRPEPASSPNQSQGDEPSARPKSVQLPIGGKYMYSKHVDFSEEVRPQEVDGRSNDNFCTDSSAMVENHTGDPTIPPTESDCDIDISSEEKSKRSKEHARLEANNCTNEPTDGGDGHGNNQGGGSSSGSDGSPSGGGGGATGSDAGSGGRGNQSGGSMGGGGGGGDDRKPPFDGGPKHETDEAPVSESKVKRKQQKATTTSGIGSSLTPSSSHEKDQLPEDLGSPTSIVSQEENPPTGTNDSTSQLVIPSSPVLLSPTTSSYKKLFPHSSKGGLSPVEQQNKAMQGMHNHGDFERPSLSESQPSEDHPTEELSGDGPSELLLPQDTTAKPSIQESEGPPDDHMDESATEEKSIFSVYIKPFLYYVYTDMQSDIVAASYPEQESKVHGALAAEGEDHPPNQHIPYSMVYTTYQLPPHSLFIVPDLGQLAIPPHQDFPVTCEPVQQMEVESMRSDDGTAMGGRDKSVRPDDGTATGERDKSTRSDDGMATGERDKSMRSDDGAATGERDKSTRSDDGMATGERDKSMRPDDRMATGERDKSTRSDDGMATGERDKSMRSDDGVARGKRDKSTRSDDGTAMGEQNQLMRGHECDSDIDRNDNTKEEERV